MMHDTRTVSQDASLGELLGDLTHEMTTLVRQEAALAKAEMSEKATRVGKDVAFLAAGGAVAYAGLLALLTALILGIARAGLPGWAAALIVGVAVAVVGGILVLKGISALKHEDLVPRQTLDTLRENT